MKPSTMLSIVQPCLASSPVKPQGQRPATDVPIVIHEDFACPRSRVGRLILAGPPGEVIKERAQAAPVPV